MIQTQFASDVRDCLCSTSLFIACCETLLGRKISGISRNPGTQAERAENVQAVLHELSDNILQTDLNHISGSRIVAGDAVDIHSLLEILAALLTGDAEYQNTGMLSDGITCCCVLTSTNKGMSSKHRLSVLHNSC